MDLRTVKATEISADMRISFADGSWRVHSQTASRYYKVNPNPSALSCECDDFALRAEPCKHILGVRQLLERQLKGEPNPTADEIPARPSRPTYKQDWASYNLAQTNEKDHFQVLLADLCSSIPQPPPTRKDGGGRPALPIGDALFAATYKVYSLLSARRFISDLREAHERGHVSRLPHFNSVLNVLDNPETTPILTDLITRSSLPLRAVETQFAVDSSGFSTSRFTRWYDEKYGCNKQQADWVKAHLCVGTKTQVVTAAVIGEEDSADCPEFAGLVNATAANFTVNEVSADKAYLSHDNLAVVDGLGAVPFIPFKSNSQGGGSQVWRKMYFYFMVNREDFLTHYHRRSNVETAFSMIKRKFGDSLRAKTDTAMKNEALAKILAHNLCCVISAWYELGIEPGDWAAPRPIRIERDNFTQRR
jgi:transposase